MPTATAIRAALANGEMTCEEVARACIERIRERERAVQAWHFFDPDLAIAQARALDRVGQRGPLAGVPVGIKDIIETADMPTEYGSPIFLGARPARDATCVAMARNAGSVVMGKTVTTEFANFTPGKTRNPHDAARTPGGSSSGSAAAVAAGMVPLAIGTQTTASTIRPASFCGIHGYRPTFGDFGCSGVMEASHSLDTIGLFARSLDDIALFRDALLGVESIAIPAETPAPRIGFCRTHLWSRVDPDVQTIIERSVQTLADAGAQVTEVALPADFDEIASIHQRISGFEFTRSLAAEIEHHWNDISERLRAGRIADGHACSYEQYRAACDAAERMRTMLAPIADPFDVLVTAASTGEAPVGLDTTGDASMCLIWTTMYVPALSLPVLRGPNGLPLGLQVIGKRHHDRALFAAARWIENILSYEDAS